MPISVVCDSCGSKYSLKDDFAGRKVKCKNCSTVLVVPASEDFPRTRPDQAYHNSFDRDKFLLNQKRISIDEKYYVYGEDKEPILFITRPSKWLRQIGAIFGAIAAFFLIFVPCLLLAVTVAKNYPPAAVTLGIMGIVGGLIACIVAAVRISPHRHIYVYTDDTKSHLLLEILQNQKFNFIRATFTVRDPIDGVLGLMIKNYLYNLFRKKWVVEAPDGSTIILAREDSLILSLLRRFGPFGVFLRTNFVFLNPASETVIGEFNRKLTLFDRYVLDLSADRDHLLDRRLAIALGVLLDTAERR